jgi:tRNA pseudouridine55 synthase
METNGALLVDKAQGLTSAAVVAIIKRHFKLKRVGHAGTLDPMATGLLVILCGKATRLQSLFLESEKVYGGVIRLGLGTNTDDLEGEVKEEDEQLEYLSKYSQKELAERVKTAFSGVQEQLPPQYSAINIDGRRSYALARKGENVSHTPRQVHIAWEEIELIQPAELSYRVRCSKGTYIRSLARDVGKFLGSCGCLQSIRRLESTPFSINQAHTLDEILEHGFENYMLSMETLVRHIPCVCLNEEECHFLEQGVQQPLAGLSTSEDLSSAPNAAVFDNSGGFRGLIRQSTGTAGKGLSGKWEIGFMLRAL